MEVLYQTHILKILSVCNLPFYFLHDVSEEQFLTFLMKTNLAFFFNIYLFLRDRDRAWAGEEQRERERETQNRKQAPGSEMSAQSPTQGSNPQIARSWPRPKSDAQQIETPRRPNLLPFLTCLLTASPKSLRIFSLNPKFRLFFLIYFFFYSFIEV